VTRPSLASFDAWGAHERLCVDLLRAALNAFPVVDPTESEDELNRRLYLHITETARTIERRDGVTLPVVVPEGQNPPLVSDQQRAVREFKRPDFYWAYHDPDGDEPARQFVVECKRLTAPSRGWSYTEQYVIAGVQRFVTPEHGYGKQAWAAAMVGYVQQIGAAAAHAEINGFLAAAALPALDPAPSPDQRIARHHHQLDRPFAQSPFRLLHLWRIPDE
jgi:hypothetical protein